jgi:hypothetical protein
MRPNLPPQTAHRVALPFPWLSEQFGMWSSPGSIVAFVGWVPVLVALADLSALLEACSLKRSGSKLNCT